VALEKTVNQQSSTNEPPAQRRAWQTPSVTSVGNLASLVQIHKVSGGFDIFTHHSGTHQS
jgi:hypothetical protein